MSRLVKDLVRMVDLISFASGQADCVHGVEERTPLSSFAAGTTGRTGFHAGLMHPDVAAFVYDQQASRQGSGGKIRPEPHVRVFTTQPMAETVLKACPALLFLLLPRPISF